MTIIIGAYRLQHRLGEFLNGVAVSKDPVVITRWNKPMAAIIPIEIYQQMIAERETRFKVLEKIRLVQPDFPSKQIQRDVQEAIIRTRKQRS